MEKPYIWRPKDAITAKRLNTLTCNLQCLLCQRIPNLSCKSRAQGSMANDGSLQEQVQPQRYDLDTALYYRHPYLGTADIVGNEAPGYYATPPAVILGDGSTEYQDQNAGCIIPYCHLDAPGSGGGSTLYIDIVTTCTGEVVGSPRYTWCKVETCLYGLNQGGGRL